jgi:hypothetical protein
LIKIVRLRFKEELTCSARVRVTERRREIPARAVSGSCSGGFRWLPDDGDGRTRYRRTRRAQKRAPPRRLHPVEEEEGDWSSVTRRWLQVTIERAHLWRTKRGERVRENRRDKVGRA